MRCAAFAVTKNGVNFSSILQDCGIGEIDIFLKNGKSSPDGLACRHYENLSDAVKIAFSRYDALIFFCAVGIAVRVIAPHLKNKLSDPAVIVIDDRAKFAVSLLSGHVGGANEMTQKIAAALGAVPVITTATDVNGILAPDAICSELGFKPHPKAMLEKINAALLDGQEITYFLDRKFDRAAFFIEKLAARGITAKILDGGDLKNLAEKLRVIVTAQPPSELPEKDATLYLIPRRLFAGIGCRRGTNKDEIKNALVAACRMVGQDIKAVSMIASTVVKSDEAGLKDLAKELNVPIKFFANEELEKKIVEYDLPQSDFVKEKIGIGNVSTAAAFCAAGRGRLALPKTKFHGVTAALVWEWQPYSADVSN